MPGSESSPVVWRCRLPAPLVCCRPRSRAGEGNSWSRKQAPPAAGRAPWQGRGAGIIGPGQPAEAAAFRRRGLGQQPVHSKGLSVRPWGPSRPPARPPASDSEPSPACSRAAPAALGLRPGPCSPCSYAPLRHRVATDLPVAASPLAASFGSGRAAGRGPARRAAPRRAPPQDVGSGGLVLRVGPPQGG